MQVPLPQALEQIKPGLTLYGVLLTFFVISFAIGRHFWNYEKELMTEHSERVRDLLLGFRLRYIEPEINGRIDSAIDGAYEFAIQGLLFDLYRNEPSGLGQFQRVLVSDEQVKELIGESALNDRLARLKETRPAEMFLSSTSGQKLLAELDQMYEKKGSVARHYAHAKRACGRTCYACLFFSLLTLLGILRVLGDWPNSITFFWLMLAVQTTAYAIYCFIKLEFHRRKLLHLWEEFEFYGKI
jgi:hypothetical protein